MAERIVYFGPFNNGKKEDLIQKSLGRLRNRKGDKFYYLLPNGELLTRYRKDFINRVGQAFEINLYTFDNIVKNILEDEIYIGINDAIKDIIIKEVICDLDFVGEITYYKDFISMEGFVQSVNGIIGEIKRSLIYPENYLKKSPQTPFFSEIGLIYKGYETYLNKHNLIDREGAYFRAIEILRNSISYFAGLDFIIIDEFYDFRPIEIAILKELCKSDIDIYINIPFDMKARLSNINETISTLKGLGFNLEYIKKEKFNFFENMGMSLFSHDAPELNYNKDLRLIKSPSIYLEFKKIFEEIKRLNINGIELKEISIVLLSDDYKDVLFEVAMEERMPISLRKENPLIEIPLIKEFLNILEVKINKIGKQSIINRLKSNYFSITDYDLKSGLEFILRGLNFNSLDELINLLDKEKNLNISMGCIEPIKELGQRIAEEINMIKEKDSIRNYNNIFMQIIDKYNLEEGIYNRYGHGKDYDLLYRDILSLEKLKETIDGMEQISLIVEEISIKSYFETLIKLFEDETILEQEENIRGIKILNPINSRGVNYDIVFITGLSQQYYPKLKENNFFINDDNHIGLKNIGLDLKNYHERLNNEAVKFASLISSCNSKLYLSFSEGMEGENISSIFLDEILGMLPGEKLYEKLNLIDIDLGYLIKDDIEKITTKEELSNYLILNRYKDLSIESKGYFSIHNQIHEEKFKSINHKMLSEFKRQKEGFNEYSGLISEYGIMEDLKEQHKGKIYSNSYLEAYGKCPYYFLLSRLLKVEEMERIFEEYKPIDIGNIYHEVLRHYYNTYKEDITNYVKGEGSFQVSDTLEYLEELVYKYGIEFGLDPTNKGNLLIIENTYDRIKEFIEADMERISDPKQRLIPHSFEVEFGGKKNFTIEIDGEEIRINGKIDRIDKLLGEEKYIIMDYKSSEYGTYNIDKMEEGISLQLPIYAMSQIDKEVVAGLYGIISKGEFQLKIGILDESKLVNKRHKGAVDAQGWTSLMDLTKFNIKDIRDSILKGDFSVNPLECSDYCLYKDICRYEKVLEVE